MSPVIDTKLITTKEAAELTGYNSDYLARLCRSGKIDGAQVGRTWVVSRISLEAFVKEQIERKQEMRDQLSEQREQEYKSAQSPVSVITPEKSIPSPFTNVISEAIPNYLTKLENHRKFQQHGVAVLSALAVMLFGLYVTQSAPVTTLADTSFTTAIAISSGFRDITSNGLALLSSDGATHEVATAVAASTNSSKSAYSTNPFAAAIATSTTRSTATIAYNKKVSRNPNAPFISYVTVPPTQAALLPTLPPLSTIATTLAAREIGAVIAPRQLAMAIAFNEVQDYVHTGTTIYSAITSGLNAYQSGIETSGTAALALGTTVRDTTSIATGSWVGLSDGILRTYAHGVYAWVNESPVVPATMTHVAYNTGSNLANIAGSIPGATATGYNVGTYGWSAATQHVAIALAKQEVGLGLGSVAAVHVALSGEKEAVDSGANLAYSAFTGSHMLASVHMATATHTHRGNSPLDLEAAAISASGLTVGEHVALTTYTTLNSFFSTAGRALAFVLGVQPKIAHAPQTPATRTAVTPSHSSTHVAAGTRTVKSTTSVTNITYVNPAADTTLLPSDLATQGYVMNAINALRSMVYGNISGQSQSVVNGTSVSPGTSYSSIGISNSAIDSSTFDRGVITNSTITGGTISTNLLTVTGTSTFATSSVVGQLSVQGDLNVTGSSSATNVFGTNAFFQNATTTNLFTTLIHGTTGIFDNLQATLATIINLNATNATTTNATSTNAFVTNSVATNASTTNGYTSQLTSDNATTTNGFATNLIAQNSSSTNLFGTNAFFTNASSTNLFAVLAHATTGIFDTLNATLATITNLTSTNFVATNATTTNATSTNQFATNSVSTNATTTNSYAQNSVTVNATSTNLNATNAVLSNASSTNQFATNANFTNASSTNLFATLAQFTTGFFSNLTATLATISGLTTTNSTTTNATSTNEFATNASFTNLIASIENIASSTITNLTATNAALLNATFTNATSTNFASTNSSLTNVAATNATTSNLAVSGFVTSDLIPAKNKTYNLGSPGNYWSTGYVDTLNVNNLNAASTSINGTVSNTFTIGSGNVTNDLQNEALIFNRGTATPNALLTWNATTKQFEFNMPVSAPIFSASTVMATNATFTNGTTTNSTSTNQFVTNLMGANAAFTSATATTLASTNAVLTNATTTNLGATNVSTTNLIGTNATLTNLSVTSTTTTAGLSIANFNGFLKATAGAIGTSLINLTTDVSGILPVPNGGTGTSSFATNGVLYGNGTNNLLTTTQGGANTILTANNGAPVFSSAVTVGTSVTSPVINSTGSIQLNGVNINTAGTLSNVAYLNQTQTLTGNNTFSGTTAFTGNTTLANATTTSLFASTFGLGIGNYFTSLLGNGLTNVNGTLTVSTSSLATGFFQQGGNAFGTTATLGTNDNNPLSFITLGTTRVTITTGGKVGIGTTAPTTSAILDLSTTTAGFLPPRLTTTQKNAIPNPAAGLAVYDTTVNKLNIFNGTSWKNVGATEINGEVTNGTPGSVLFVADGGVLGQDNANFNYATSTGRFGIGTSTPGATLGVNGTGYFTGAFSADGLGTFGNVISTGLTPNTLTYANASKQLASVTIGTGLSFSAGTLSNTGVTSVAASGGTTGLSFTGSPITTTGTFTLGGVLAVANGGTNISTPTAAGVLLGNYTGTGYQQIATSSLGILTTNVAEGTNLYFTNARTIASTLTGYTSAPGTITASDSILSAIQKLNGNTTALVTGVSSVSNSDGSLTISPTTGAVVASLALGHVNTFTAEQNFNGNASLSGTNYLLLNGASDTNWRIGLNTASFTHSLVSNSIDITNGTGTNDGFAIGGTGGNSEFEIKGSTGQAYFRGAVTIGTTTPANAGAQLTVSNNQNGLTALYISNTTTGTLARTNLSLNTDTGSPLINIDAFSSTYASAGTDDAQNGARLFASGTGGFAFRVSNAAASIRFYTGSTERMRVDSTGNVGIGTTTPGSTLSIAGTSFTSGIATVGGIIDNALTANTLQYTNASKQEASVTLPSYVSLTSGTLAINSLPIANGGTNATSQTTNGIAYFDGTKLTTGSALTFDGTNVTIPQNIISSAASLGTFGFSNTASSGVYGGFNGASITGAYFQLFGSTASGSGTTPGGGGEFVINSSNAATKFNILNYNGSSYTQLFNVLSSGNVGIGTTTPGSTLSVNGNGYFNSNVTAQSFIATSSISTPLLTAASIVDSGLPANSLVYDNGSEQLAATTIGSGLTFSGGTLAAVGGTSTTSLATQFYQQNGNAFGVAATFGTTDSNILNFITGNSVKATLGTTGNFGVGSSTPFAKLSIKSSGTTTGVTFQTTDSSSNTRFTLLDNGSFTDTPLLTNTSGGNTGAQVIVAAIPTGSTITGTYGGFRGVVQYNGSASTTNAVTGIQGVGELFNSSKANQTQGIYGIAQYDGSDAVTNAQGEAPSSLYGGRFQATVQGTGNITHVIGIKIDGPYVNGSADQAFGLYLQDMTNTGSGTIGGTSALEVEGAGTGNSISFSGNGGSGINAKIYSSAASQLNIEASSNLLLNTLGGNVGIGTSTPGSTLAIAGTSFTSGIATAGGFIDNTETANALTYANASKQLSSVTIGSGLTFSAGTLAATGAVSTTSLASNFFQQNGNAFGAIASLGTNDTFNLAFKTNNVQRGVFDTSGNFGIGVTSPTQKLDVAGFINTDQYSGYKQNGNTILYASSTNVSTVVGIGAGRNLISSSTVSYSTALGYQALNSTNLSGGLNTAVGYAALTVDTTGGNNTAIGVQALTANTTGGANDAFGYFALGANTTGGANDAFGSNAQAALTTGGNNVAFGGGALAHNITGNYNSAFGYQAGLYNQSATSTISIGYRAGYGGANFNNQASVAIGFQSGFSFQAGSDYNTLLGFQSGYGVTTGSRNVLLGQSTITASQNQVTTGSNNIAIGNDVAVPSATASNQLDIGNFIYGTGLSGTGASISPGFIGIGTTTPAATLGVAGNIYLSGNISQPSTSNVNFGNIYATGPIGVQATAGGLSANGTISGIASTGILSTGGNIAVWNGSQFVAYSDGGVTKTISLSPSGVSYLNGGNVGIGTTTPINKLSVNGGIDIAGGASEPTGYSGLYLGFNSSNNKANIDNVQAGTAFHELDINANPLVLNAGSGGNVGIGTTTPSSLLTVENDAASATTLMVQNNSTASGARSRIVFSKDGATANGFVQYRSDATFNDFIVGTNGAIPTAFYTNGIERARFDTSGNFGIGTGTPATNLSVSGNAYVTSGLGVGVVNTAVGTIAAANYSTNQLLINGMGGEGNEIIDAYGDTTKRWQLDNNNGVFTINGSGTNSLAFAIKVAGTASFVAYNGGIGIGSTYAGSFVSNAPPANGLIVQGSVGIGTTSPFAPLSVQTSAAAGTNTILAAFGSSVTSRIKFYDEGPILGNGITYGGTISGNSGAPLLLEDAPNSGAGLAFATNGSERMRITSSGNVGIGTTSPGSTLAVQGGGIIFANSGNVGYGSLYNDAGLHLAADNTTNNGIYLSAGGSGIQIRPTASGTTVTQLNTTGGNSYINSTGGNVGIGTVAPTTVLDIVAAGVSTAGVVQRIAGNVANGAFTQYTDASGLNYGIGIKPTTGNFALFAGRFPGTAGTETFTVTQAGNVGIGSSTPNSLLTVSGGTPANSMVYSGTNAAATNVYSAITPSPTSGSVAYSAGIFDTQSNNSGSASSAVSGLIGSAFDAATTTAAQTSIVGIQGTGRHLGTNTLGTLGGANFTANNRSAGGLVTTEYGLSSTANTNNGTGATSTNLYAILAAANTGSPYGGATVSAGLDVAQTNTGANDLVTGSYGVKIENLSNTAGTITNSYGVYVGSQTAGTQTNHPYSFYAADTSAYNYFGGNVGIGTTTPGSALSVNGNLYVNGNGRFGTGILENDDIYLYDSNTGSGVFTIEAGANGSDAYFNFYGNGNEIVQGTLSAGNLIDNGLSANTLAYANGSNQLSSVTIGSGLTFTGGTLSATGGSGSGTVNTGTTGQFPYYAANGTTLTATSSLFLAANSYIGIGTTSPNSQLTVAGAGQSTSALSDSGATGGTIQINDTHDSVGAGGALTFGFLADSGKQSVGAAIKAYETAGFNAGTADLVFSTRNTITDTALTERLRILSGGNVGIGTSTPGSLLSIAGTSFTSGTATVGNLINNGVTANSLTYADGNKQNASVTLPSYITLTSGTLAISALPNAQLANSTISGVALGSNLNTLTFGTHLTGTSYNGSGAVTLGTDATSANSPATIVARDGSGNFSAGTITATLNGNASTVTTDANLTGAITSVGNATSLGSFTSAALAAAISDETGSGAAVFAASPTFTSNLTFSTAGSNILVPQGSTNALSFATSTGATPILTLSSIAGSASGAVGIGTSTPWGKLSVEMGPLNPAFVVSNNGSSTPSLIVTGVNQNGYVGIGVTSPISELSNTSVNVVDGAGTGSNLTNGFTWAANSTGYAASLTNNSSLSNANGLFVKTVGTAATNRLLTLNANGTDAFVVQGNGNVGIGTTTPGSILSIGGSGTISPIANFASTTSSVYSNLSVLPTRSSSFTSMGTVATGFSPYSVAVSGRYAYVVNNLSNTLQIFDTSNPTSPTSVSTFTTGTNPESVSVSGNYAYVTNYGSNTLQVIDISNPANPISVGTVTTGSHPRSVAVSGRYAYVTNYSSNTLQVIDISNPANPTSVGTVSTASGPYSIAVSGRYAYVTNYLNSSFQVFDISNPVTPVSVSTTSGYGNPSSVAISGRYAYVTSYGSNVLEIYNISNPASPTSVNNFGTGNQPQSVAVSGRYAYVVNNSSATLQVIDISNPANPTSVGTVTTGTSPYQVAISGRYAYVVNNSSATLQIIDVGGEEVNGLIASSLEAGQLQVKNDITAQGQLSVTGGGTFGGGLNLNGPFSLTASTPNATTTASQNYSIFSVGTASSTSSILSALYNGNVGIGTTTPNAQLVVDGLGQTSSALTAESGNLGGTLALQDTGNAAGNGGALLFGAGNAAGTGDVNFAAIKGLLTNAGTKGTGDLAFSTRNAVSDATLTERMRITAAGNVGIGTTNPGVALSVVGNGAFGTSTPPVTRNLTVLSGGSGQQAAYFGDIAAGLMFQDASGVANIVGENVYNNANNPIQFSTGGTPSLYISAGSPGNVGIGTTTPSANLTINGTTGQNLFQIASSTNQNIFTVNANGNVGINTASPTVGKLQIDGGGTGTGEFAALALRNTGASGGDNVSIVLKPAAGGGIPGAKITATAPGSSNTDLVFYTSSVGAQQESVRFLGNGNVGIGTASPGSKLDVAGNINIDQYSSYKQAGNTILYASSTSNSISFGIGAAPAFQTSATPQNSVAIGKGALAVVTTGVYNVALGSQSMDTGLTTGSQNVALGYATLKFNNATNTVAVGYQAGFGNGGNIQGSQNNVFIGYQADQLNVNGSNNFYGGYQAGLNATSTGNNVGLGYQALFGSSANSSGNANVGIGYQALTVNSSGTTNAAVGNSALSANTTGSYNAALGGSALSANTTGVENVAIGYSALQANTTGSDNVAIGKRTLNGNTLATNVVALGKEAGYGSGAYSNTGATLIGTSAGFNFQTGSDYNTLVGFQSGYGITTGARNVLIGQSTISASQNQVTTGSNNIAIGNDVAVASPTASNQLNIGNLIYGTGLSGTGSTIAGNIGIGTTTPISKLDISDGGTSAITSDITLEGALNAVNAGHSIDFMGGGSQSANNNAYARLVGQTDSVGGGGVLSFYTASTLGSAATERMRITAAGYVGIGTSSPLNTLDVGNAAVGTINGGIGTNVTISNSTANSTLAFGQSTTARGRLQWVYNATPANAVMILGDALGTHNLALQDQGGNVGIGTLNPDAKLNVYNVGNTGVTAAHIAGVAGNLYVDYAGGGGNYLDGGGTYFRTYGGTGYAYFNSVGLSVGNSGSPSYALDAGSSGTSGIVARFTNSTGNCTINPTTTSLSCSSDSRLKKNVTTVDTSNALANLDKLSPVLYNWNAEVNGTAQHAGFIAQAMQQVYPDLVSTDPVTGYLTLNYGGLTPYLVAGLQQEDAKVTALASTTAAFAANGTPAFTTDASGNVGLGVAAGTALTSKFVVNGGVTAASVTTSGVGTFGGVVTAPDYQLSALTLGSSTPSAALSAAGTSLSLANFANYTFSSITTLNTQTNSLATQLQTLTSRVANLETMVATTGMSTSSLEAAVAGATASSTGSSTLADATTTMMNVLNGMGVLLEKGIAQFNTLVVRDLVFSKDTDGASAAGSGTVLAGNVTVEIDNSHMLASSQVSVTLTSPMNGNWYVTDKKDGSFQVTLSAAQAADVTFDYLIVQTSGQIATSTPIGTTNPGAFSVSSWLASLFGGSTTPSSSSSTGGTTSPSTGSTSGSTGTGSGTAPVAPANPNAPVITLNGSPALALNQGDVFIDPGATAVDASSTDISSSIVVTGSVDTSTGGMYTLTYTATDAAGNTSHVSRLVTVTATSAPAPTSSSTTGTSGAGSAGTTSGSSSSSSDTSSGSSTSAPAPSPAPAPAAAPAPTDSGSAAPAAAPAPSDAGSGGN